MWSFTGWGVRYIITAMQAVVDRAIKINFAYASQEVAAVIFFYLLVTFAPLVFG